jgi:hypothetical protein
MTGRLVGSSTPGAGTRCAVDQICGRKLVFAHCPARHRGSSSGEWWGLNPQVRVLKPPAGIQDSPLAFLFIKFALFLRSSAPPACVSGALPRVTWRTLSCNVPGLNGFRLVEHAGIASTRNGLFVRLCPLCCA